MQTLPYLTDLIYPHILKVNRGYLHTRGFRRIHCFSILINKKMGLPALKPGPHSPVHKPVKGDGISEQLLVWDMNLFLNSATPHDLPRYML